MGNQGKIRLEWMLLPHCVTQQLVMVTQKHGVQRTVDILDLLHHFAPQIYYWTDINYIYIGGLDTSTVRAAWQAIEHYYYCRSRILVPQYVNVSVRLLFVYFISYRV